MVVEMGKRLVNLENILVSDRKTPLSLMKYAMMSYRKGSYNSCRGIGKT